MVSETRNGGDDALFIDGGEGELVMVEGDRPTRGVVDVDVNLEDI